MWSPARRAAYFVEVCLALFLFIVTIPNAHGQSPALYAASAGNPSSVSESFISTVTPNLPGCGSPPQVYQSDPGPYVPLYQQVGLKKVDGGWIAQSFPTTMREDVPDFPPYRFSQSFSSGGVSTTERYFVYNHIDNGVNTSNGWEDDVETIDFNSGHIHLHERAEITTLPDNAASCGGTLHATSDFDGSVNIIYSPLQNVQASLAIVNPAAAGEGPFPHNIAIPENAVSDAATPTATGLAADGTSAAVLLFQSTAPDAVIFTLTSNSTAANMGSLASYRQDYLTNPSPGGGGTVSATPINQATCGASGTETCVFLALLYAPPQISYDGTQAQGGTGIQLNIMGSQEAADGTIEASATSSVQLMPPPLVLVHGIWSSANSAWTPFSAWINNNYPHHLIERADYEQFNSLSFEDSRVQNVLATSISNVLTKAAKQGVVAQQVDVFGHSMGGLVTRFFVDKGVPLFSTVYLPKSPVHQVVTVGTPQDGSPFAVFLEQNKKATLAGGGQPGQLGYPVISAVCNQTPSCTLADWFANTGRTIGDAVESLQQGYKVSSKPYRSIVGQASYSTTGLILNLALKAFGTNGTVQSVLGSDNDTIVPSSDQSVGATDSVVLPDNLVHTKIGWRDTGETESQSVWSQAVFWLLGGSGPAPENVSTSTGRLAKVLAHPNDSTTPPTILDLTGYAQVDASNFSIMPSSGTALTVNDVANIAVTSSTKSLSELLLLQPVSDPTDTALYSATQAPFSIPFTATHLGSVNFTIFAVFNDNTYAEQTVEYPLQASSNPVSLDVSAPIANLPVGLNLIAATEAIYANGSIDVTSLATYKAHSGASSVFSLSPGGNMTTTGNGIDLLDVTYAGISTSTPITVGTCTFTLGPSQQLIEQGGGAAAIQVSTQAGCSWTADPGNATWLSLSGASGTGSGTMSAHAAANTTGSTLTAFITLAGQDVAVIQPAAYCVYTLNPVQVAATSSGANGTITVTTSCPLFAEASDSWITATPIGSSVAYVILPNNTPTARNGTITIGDQTVTIQEAAAVPAITLGSASPPLSITAPGGSATAAIQVVPVNGFTGAVTIACSVTFQGQGTSADLPTCSLSPQAVQITGSTSALSTLTISTTAATSTFLLPGPSNKSIVIASVLLFWFYPSRRRFGRLFLLFPSLFLLAALTACGGSTPSPQGNPGTTAGSYQIVITANGGPSSATTKLALSVE